MRTFENQRVAIAALALLALLAPRSAGRAQDGAVLVTEGVGPRAAAGLRSDLSRRWNRPVLAMHERGAESAPHLVSVSVRDGQVYVQYRSGTTIRNGQGRASGRRAQLLQAVMAAVEDVGPTFANAESMTRTVDATSAQHAESASTSATFGATLLALDLESMPRASASASSMRTDDGILLGLVDESTTLRSQVLLATETDQDATHVRQVRTESAGGVMLAIE